MSLIKKGDEVIVIAGKDKGKKGKVLKVFPEDERISVEGVNIAKRHQRQLSEKKPAGIMDKVMPLHISNVALIDPKSGKATRAGRRKEKDEWVRFAKKSGQAV